MSVWRRIEIRHNPQLRVPSSFHQLLDVEKERSFVNEDLEIPSPAVNKVLELTYAKHLVTHQVVSLVATTIAAAKVTISDEKGKVLLGAGFPFKPNGPYAIFQKPTQSQSYTWFELLEAIIINLLTTGEAYVEKVRDKDGKVVELWPLPGSYIKPVADSKSWIDGFVFGTEENNKTIPRENMFYIRHYSTLSSWRGLSPFAGMQEDIASDVLMSRWSNKFFEQRARPYFVLQGTTAATQDKDEIKRLGIAFRDAYGNPNSEATPSIPVLPFGLTLQELKTTHEEMDFINGRAFIAAEGAAALGIPLSLLPQTRLIQPGNRAMAEADMLQYLFNVIYPLLIRIDDKINLDDSLVEPSHTFKLDRQTIPSVRRIILESASEIRQLVQNGVMTPNEARVLLDLPRAETPEADMLHKSKNTVPLDFVEEKSLKTNEHDRGFDELVEVLANSTSNDHNSNGRM